MNQVRAICDFFIDRDDVEYIAEVYSAEEGFAEDYGVYILQEDGSKGDSVETGQFDSEVQKRFWDWSQELFDDGRDSYPASHY